MKRLSPALRKFFFEPASARPLAWLRIGLAAVLLLQAALVAPDYLALYGRGGWLQGFLGEYLQTVSLPSARTLAGGLATLGIDETTGLLALGAAYLLSLCAMLAGWHTRRVTGAAWLLHWLITGGQVTSYGVDQFANVFLFYLMLSPSGSAHSLDLLQGRASATPSAEARFFLRALQLHLCLTYLAAGADKAMGEQWWNGEAIWRSLMLPIYSRYPLGSLCRVPWLAKGLGWGTLVVEMGYVVFIWPRSTRRFWIAATVGLHLGIGVFLGLGTFSLVMACFTLSLFGVPADGAGGWKKELAVAGRPARLTGYFAT